MKCLNCGTELKLKNQKEQEIGIVLLSEKDEEFLRESNAIERVYSEGALEAAKEAYIYAYRYRNKITIKTILEIHHILMRKLNKKIAGKIREVPVYIGGEVRSQSKEEILRELKLLLKTLWKKKDEEGIKKSHIYFEKIHPFEDGNGRTGRILMNVQRLNAGLPILVIHEGLEQLIYYRWFK